MSMCNKIIPGRMLTTRWISPLKFSSGCGYLGNTEYSTRKQISLSPRSFTGQRDVTQNNELMIEIAWSYKSYYIRNWKEKKKKKERILQGKILWRCINIRQTGKLFILPRKIKRVEEVFWENLREQEHWAIQKCKDT